MGEVGRKNSVDLSAVHQEGDVAIFNQDYKEKDYSITLLFDQFGKIVTDAELAAAMRKSNPTNQGIDDTTLAKRAIKNLRSRMNTDAAIIRRLTDRTGFILLKK